VSNSVNGLGSMTLDVSALTSQSVRSGNFKAALDQEMSSDSTTSAKPESKKIADAAKQFEALMIGQILKIARETSSEGWLGSGEDSSSETGMDMAQEFFGQALANGGGLGIGKMIERQLNAQPASKAANSGLSIGPATPARTENQPE